MQLASPNDICITGHCRYDQPYEYVCDYIISVLTPLDFRGNRPLTEK
jgi:hypothetical protein